MREKNPPEAAPSGGVGESAPPAGRDLSSDGPADAALPAGARGVDTPGEVPTSGTKEDRRTGPDLNLIRAGATVLALLGVLALLHFAASVFITLFSSLLLAFALEPMVQLLCVRTRLRRHHASAVVVFLFVAMLYGLFYATYQRAGSFLADIPAIAEKIRSAPMVANLTEKAEELNRLFAEAGRRIAPPTAPARTKASPPITLPDTESFIGALLQGLGSLSGILFSLGFIPFLVYFILADREPLTRRTRELFPEEYRSTVGEILIDIELMMRKFLLGNAVIALILSIATVLVFLLVGLPYPIVLGILSGTLSIVPYLGLPLALLPGVVVGLITFESGVAFLVLVISVTAFHLVAANFLTPKLVGGGVRLNATASTVALLFFGWLWGGMGLVLGIPILAVLKCIFDNIPSTRRIGMFLGV
jgi:predicted PurR-regulated permease PerM